jgi:hypothetical protein
MWRFEISAKCTRNDIIAYEGIANSHDMRACLTRPPISRDRRNGTLIRASRTTL